jgi:pimeloyl-ACP methyl ester carboxylesterase
VETEAWFSRPKLNMKIPVAICLFVALSVFARSQDLSAPKPIGKMVDVGGHKVHLHCTGKGSPTVVVENGFDEFSFDWTLVQERVEKFARICTYDRAGYAWSEPGPKPRTYAQLNLELHELLTKAAEHGPYVLVGHSFGGPVVRNYAMTYPREVAGIVLVDTVAESQRVVIGKQAMRLDAMAKGVPIPKPRMHMLATDRPKIETRQEPEQGKIEPPYDRLPDASQKLHLWADPLPNREDAQGSERQWSPEYLAKWVAAPDSVRLGKVPLIVLSRERGGYGDGLDIPAAKLESERRQAQLGLAEFSSAGKHRFVNSGHDMQVEAPDEVASAIKDVVSRSGRK